MTRVGEIDHSALLDCAKVQRSDTPAARIILIWDYVVANLERRHCDTLGSGLVAWSRRLYRPRRDQRLPVPG